MDNRLLELLVCPVCKGPLSHAKPSNFPFEALVCAADRLAFPVHDGIPVMIEAQAIALDESGQPKAPGAVAAPAADVS